MAGKPRLEANHLKELIDFWYRKSFMTVSEDYRVYSLRKADRYANFLAQLTGWWTDEKPYDKAL